MRFKTLTLDEDSLIKLLNSMDVESQLNFISSSPHYIMIKYLIEYKQAVFWQIVKTSAESGLLGLLKKFVLKKIPGHFCSVAYNVLVDHIAKQRASILQKSRKTVPFTTVESN
ncbi:hypothetical protein TNCV_2984211 [Trichonephila clavipes]|nr:hypothetical protein TNCV_2984211 [Trichonephila clavipes]